MPARIDLRNRTLPRLVRGVAALALGLGGLTACGGNGSDTAATASTGSAAGSTAASSSAPSSVATQGQTLTATEADFSISVKQDVAAGSYTIDVVNDGNATHNLVVEQGGNDVAKSDSIGPGDKATLTVELTPGEYVFYCSVGNHRERGMEKTVTVQ